MTTKDLEPWFQHLTHARWHRTIDIGNKMDSENLSERDIISSSRIRHRYSYEIVEVHPDVERLYHEIVADEARIIDPEDKDSDLNVDIVVIEQYLCGLVNALGLDAQFTLFIMTPKDVDRNKIYGYRIGFSREEMSSYRRDSRFNSLLDLKLNGNPKHWQVEEKAKNPWHRFAESFQPTKEEVQSMHGLSKAYVGWYEQHVRMPESLTPSSQDDLQSLSLQRALRVLQRLPASMVHVLSEESGDNCLTDMWSCTNCTAAWMDLTAGPFAWGPTTGGTNIREESSFPSLQRLRDHALHGDRGQATSSHEEDTNIVGRGESETQATEIAWMQSFVDRYCTEGSSEHRISSKLCDTMVPRLNAAKAGAATGSILRGDMEDGDNVDTDEETNHMGAREHRAAGAATLESIIDREELVAHNDRYVLLSLLAARMDHLLHTWVSPPAVVLPTSFTSRILLQVVVLSLQDSYDPLDTLDVGGLKQHVAGLLMDGMEVTMGSVLLHHNSEPAVSAAVAAAVSVERIADVQPGTGEFVSRRLLSLDAHALRHALLEKSDFLGDLHATESADVSENRILSLRHQRTITVVIVSFGGDEPVLVNGIEPAVALPNMVVAAQSNVREWPSRIQCNGQPSVWDLREPQTHILKALSEAVAGLAPLQLSTNVLGREQTSWLHLPSASPRCDLLSNAFATLTATDANLAHRHWLLDSLDRSIIFTEEGIRALERVPTSSRNYHAMDESDVKNTKDLYRNLRALWKWSQADLRKDHQQQKQTQRASNLIAMSTAGELFRREAVRLAEKLLEGSCTQSVEVHGMAWYTHAICVTLLSTGLFALWVWRIWHNQHRRRLARKID